VDKRRFATAADPHDFDEGITVGFEGWLRQAPPLAPSPPVGRAGPRLENSHAGGVLDRALLGLRV
jgi:hypothetical protein